MRASLGQPVIIENVTGAGGSIGTGRVALAGGDGNTLDLGFWDTHVANGALYTLRYIAGSLAAYLTLLHLCGSEAVIGHSPPPFDTDFFTLWNAAGTDLRSVLTPPYRSSVA
jgi:hypothetical protein